jgi:hypothetical protein
LVSHKNYAGLHRRQNKRNKRDGRLALAFHMRIIRNSLCICRANHFHPLALKAMLEMCVAPVSVITTQRMTSKVNLQPSKVSLPFVSD